MNPAIQSIESGKREGVVELGRRWPNARADIYIINAVFLHPSSCAMEHMYKCTKHAVLNFEIYLHEKYALRCSLKTVFPHTHSFSSVVRL